MKLAKLLEVHTVLKMLGSQATPLRLTIARNLAVTEPIINAFTSTKDDKFNELVKLDEDGVPVLNEVTQAAIADGKVNVMQGLPFRAYEFENENGLEAMATLVEGLKKEEKEVEFISISLNKKIRLKEEGEKAIDIVLADLLEAPDSQISADALKVLLDVGIIKD